MLVPYEEGFAAVVEGGAQHALVVDDRLPGGVEAFAVQGAVPGPGELGEVPAGEGVGVGEQLALQRGGHQGGGGPCGRGAGEQVGEQAVGEGVARCVHVVGGQPQRVVLVAEAVDPVTPHRRVGVVGGEVVGAASSRAGPSGPRSSRAGVS